MIKYLWFGMCADDKLKNQIIDNGGKILSASVSQDNFFYGLQEKIKIDSINAFRVAPYPKYKKKYVEEYIWEDKAGKHISVGYKNIKYLSHIYKTKALKKAAKDWAIKNKDDYVKIIVYSMHSPFMEAAKTVKSTVKKCEICLIVPDLPQYMDLGMSNVKKILKKYDWLKIKKLMKSVDKYVLYTKYMAEFLKLKDNFKVIEGSLNDKDIVDYEPVEKKVKGIMYSGVCDLRYGIPELIEAFISIKGEDLELWITGVGNAVDLIKEKAKTDKRIKYFGFLPTREDLLKKQKEATMLVSMRKPTEKASAYCFPSKLFEYMISGNPVLSFKIDGIPDEYFDYLIEMKSTEIKDIRNSIVSVLNLDDEKRKELGEKSKNFVLNNKNKINQSKILLEFVNR